MMNDYEAIVRREIVTTRVFEAPRELVFAAWTDPDELKQWWGPRGFSNTFHVCEMKAGGLWSYTMHGPNGTEYQNEARFVEITAPERIVIEHTSPPRFQLTVLFDEIGKNTKITFRQLFETPAVFDQVKRLALQGNEENLDRLAKIPERKTGKLEDRVTARRIRRGRGCRG